MRFRTSTAALGLALLALQPASRAQQPTLDQLLHRLQANLNHFDKTVPSFFADEHVVSTMDSDHRLTSTTSDSTFHMKRVSAPDHTTSFLESRDIRTINGEPATAHDLDLDGPSVLSGAFESALAIVSLDQTACMNYQLQRIHPQRPTEPYIIRFSTALSDQNADACLLQEKSSGRILLDPASLHINRVEITTPHHTIIAAHFDDPPVIGKRILTVDYAPILLDGDTVWMPSTITMKAISGSGTFHVTIWSFTATYSNYHKLKVTHRILPTNTPPTH